MTAATTASLTDPPALTVIHPGPGLGNLGTIGVQFKLSGTQTNGTVSIVEHPFPVGALVPAHLHTLEDEYSLVTEGAIGFRSGDREVVLGAGGYITKPRGEMHTMWNAGPVPTRMIEIISPSRFRASSANSPRCSPPAHQTPSSSAPSPAGTESSSANPTGSPTSSPATT